jgi:hypothetical protein
MPSNSKCSAGVCTRVITQKQDALRCAQKSIDIASDQYYDNDDIVIEVSVLFSQVLVYSLFCEFFLQDKLIMIIVHQSG